MSSEHNSILISKLNNSKEVDEAIDILEEMEEVADPVFLWPVIDAYRKYKNSSGGHYFLSTLSHIQSKDIQASLLTLFTEIQAEGKNQDHLPWVISAMSAHKYYPEKIIAFVVKNINNYTDTVYFDPKERYAYDLETFLSYCKDAGIIEQLSEDLKNLWEEVGKAEKIVVLRHFLRLKSAKPFDYFLENYKPGENEDMDIILAKELVGWTGGGVRKLKNIIITSGYVRAKEILQMEQESLKKKQQKEEKENQQKVSGLFANVQVASDIRALRRQINNKTLSSPNFQFRIFPESELIGDQARSAKTREEFTQCCIDLRSIISDLNKTINNHSLEEDTVDKLLNGVSEEHKEKTFNQLYLYLVAKQYKVNITMFGIRKLNRILSLVAHPGDHKYLLDELKRQNLLDDYNAENFHKIHSQLLEKYKEFLFELDKLVTTTP